MITLLETPGGVRFGYTGEKPAAPAPTLFLLASSLEANLTDTDFCEAAHILADRGVFSVSADVPCHGCDKRPGETVGLVGWRERMEAGENPFEAFVAGCSAVLDSLIEGQFTDPERVAVLGNSRGGFSAMHFAAGEPRIKAAAAIAPVTKLAALREFAGMDDHPIAASLALKNHASRLAGRPIWMIIGNRDERVNTDYAIEFARAVVAATERNLEETVNVEIAIVPSIGHRNPPNAHTLAAAWLAKHLEL